MEKNSNCLFEEKTVFTKATKKIKLFRNKLKCIRPLSIRKTLKHSWTIQSKLEQTDIPYSLAKVIYHKDVDFPKLMSNNIIQIKIPANVFLELNKLMLEFIHKEYVHIVFSVYIKIWIIYTNTNACTHKTDLFL